MAFRKAGKPSDDSGTSLPVNNPASTSSRSKRSTPVARPADWPPVNTEIVIVLPRDGGVFRAKVSDHDKLNGQFVLMTPGEGSQEIPATPGDKAMATWTTAAGLHELKTEIVDSPDPSVKWKVEPTSPVVVHERRRFPRVRRPAGIQLETNQAQAISATMLDLSEGGARCVIDTSHVIPPDMLQTTLDLDDHSVKIKGWVAWKKLHGQHTEIGVSFAGVSKRDADLIRRYVLAIHGRQSQKRSTEASSE
ncbi:MAG TPA: PilZ domain-containing protein [Acidimicrobiales bacterium]|nr:PilZ domain-containing protein [Acidimicrobiales bacterium]